MATAHECQQQEMIKVLGKQGRQHGGAIAEVNRKVDDLKKDGDEMREELAAVKADVGVVKGKVDQVEDSLVGLLGSVATKGAVEEANRAQLKQIAIIVIGTITAVSTILGIVLSVIALGARAVGG